jgi:hypothetical protein
VHRKDVGVVETGRDPDLSQEALGPAAPAQLRIQDLERDPPVMPQVVRKVDGGHAPTPELLLERVAVAKGTVEQFQGLVQGDLSGRRAL